MSKLREGSHSLGFLNSAQFLGALNDNIFKLVVVFLLIQKEGRSDASDILSLVGALFVAPFLLFSSTAGVLADRFSKQMLLKMMKMAEMLLMLSAIFAFAYHSTWGSYILLFILATHSALFGPSKYGIIPELVPPEKISKANGLVTSFTYLAIILGTFLASFLTKITHRNFALIAGFCLFIALLGFLSTLGIKKTSPQHPEKKFNPLFVREIFYTLIYAGGIRHLFTAICGSAFFLFIGAFVQLNIIPFAIQDLNLDEVAGGYLFLATALGIALGSLIAGKASKTRVELGLSCLAGVGIALFLTLLWAFSHHLPSVIAFLVLVGICGGAFIVPFDTFIQTFSPDEKRGQIIGAVNFLSFLGVLLASFSLYLFSGIFRLTAAQGFAIMGGITLLATLIFTAKLSDLALGYFSRRLIKPFFTLHIENEKALENASLLILENATPLKALLLLVIKPNIRFLVPHSYQPRFSLFSSKIPENGSLHAIPTPYGMINCLYLKKEATPDPNAIIVQSIRQKRSSWTISFKE